MPKEVKKAAKKEDAKKAAPKKVEAKKEAPKKEVKGDPKKATPKKLETKKEAPKKEAPKKVEAKKEAPKKVEEKEDINKIYHISKRKEDGMWQVKFANGQKAIKLFKTQEEAIAYAKKLAVNQEGSISIHKVDGKIRKQNYNK